MTGQDLLDRMELLNRELQLQSGEEDVTRGLLALNVAQDHFESIAAMRKNLFGSSVGTVVTVSSTETTAYPTGVMRIDRLQTISAVTSRPDGELERLHRIGGHAIHTSWPWSVVIPSGSGKPKAYWTNGTYIYWSPLPDGAYTVRYYGFTAASAITAGGTFAYPDIVALPLAIFAGKLMKMGLDDPSDDLDTLAGQIFKPVLDTLSNYNPDGAKGLEYTTVHSE